jgi:hypothetical protein
LALCTACGTNWSPGTIIQFQYDPGTGTVMASFDLERSYRNFVLYLHDKLRPDYFAIMIEVNIYKTFCPTKWSGLVDLYRSIYDSVRAEVDPQAKVFATVTFQNLLNYDVEQCFGPLAFEACVGVPSPPAYPDPDPLTCYPLDLSVITDLDQGDRLEILALSFYPDNLLMAVSENDNLLNAYPEDWDEISDCLMRALSDARPASALSRPHRRSGPLQLEQANRRRRAGRAILSNLSIY